MTPSSNPHIRATGLINDGWLVFGSLLAESFAPAPRQTPAPQAPAPQAKEARVLWGKGRLHRLMLWWTKPLPPAAHGGATDAATRLEILACGGFPR